MIDDLSVGGVGDTDVFGVDQAARRGGVGASGGTEDI